MFKERKFLNLRSRRIVDSTAMSDLGAKHVRCNVMLFTLGPIDSKEASEGSTSSSCRVHKLSSPVCSLKNLVMSMLHCAELLSPETRSSMTLSGGCEADDVEATEVKRFDFEDFTLDSPTFVFRIILLMHKVESAIRIGVLVAFCVRKIKTHP